MRLSRIVFGSLAAFGFLAALALPEARADGIGVILFHSRGSWPGEFENVGPKLEAAGLGQVAPELCWSRLRIYGGTLDQCMADVDKAIGELKAKGYDRIVLLGHELGGLSALYYAVKHPEIAGLILMVPNRRRLNAQEEIGEAEARVKAGEADQRANFGSGRVYTTPRAFLSFEGPESPLEEEDLLPKLSAPLLWIAAKDDVGPRDPGDFFSKAPKNPLTRLVRSEDDFYSLIDRSTDLVIGWIEALKATPAAR